MITKILDRPLAVFDIESTGLNKKLDRIIDLGIVRIEPDGTRKEQTFRINPGCPIPPDSSAVHGIKDEDVADAPLFADVAPEIAAFLEGCDLAGFNLNRFDVPMLVEEFNRVGQPFSLEGRRILDVQRIYHAKEPRDLTAALQFYCGEMHLGAHGAIDDVKATVRVLEAQLEKYSDLPSDMDGLHEFCNPTDPTWVDQTGKLRWDQSEIVINFGQKQGVKVRELMLNDKGYLDWILKKDFPDDTKEIIRLCMMGKPPKPPTPAQK
jgi:DNA polymerase III subunit epsilon